MAKQEPVLVNMNRYIVGVTTPEGRYMNLQPGQGVAGPGFEKDAASGKLQRVDVDDARFTVVYETPATLKVVAPPKPAPAKPASKSAAPAARAAEEAPDSRKAAEPTTPMPKPKGKKKSFTIPEAREIRRMKKDDLVVLLAQLGKRDTGTKTQLVNRLMPLAGKEVTPKE